MAKDINRLAHSITEQATEEKNPAAVALHFMYYNFCRPHKTLNKERNLGITPAMAAGVTDRAWKIQEIIELANIENL